MMGFQLISSREMDNIKAECLLLGLVLVTLAAADPHWTGFRFRFSNPCFYKRCPRYAQCEVTKDYRAQCVCPKACTKDFKPVCGTDWKTYSNECELTRKSCEAGSHLRIRYDGPCEAGSCRRTAWKNLRCPYSSRCEMNHGLPRCICPQETCSASYEPVCGSDQKSYRNTCELEKASCQEKKVLYVWHQGHCRSDPCARIDCCCGAQCEVNETKHARCVCNFACTLQYEPVCGSDGNTYGNACELRSAACAQQNPKLVAVSDGQCPNITSPPTTITPSTPYYENPCDAATCNGVCQVIDGEWRCVPITKPTTATTPSLCSEITCIYSECAVIDGKATCLCPLLCPTIVKPVCGSNGVTYGNLCELKRDSCKKSLLITYYHYGPCADEPTSHPPVTTEPSPDTTYSPTTDEHTTSPPTINPCATVKCDFYASCEVRNGSAKCVCPKICLHAYYPVCGSNGVSYGNLCELQKASCEQKKDITVVKQGYCSAPILSCPTPRTCNTFCDEYKCRRRGKLCCCQGCGQVCTTPVKRYGRYMCPPIIDQCDSDLSCSAGEKCCLDGCGKKCVAAVPTINTYGLP